MLTNKKGELKHCCSNCGSAFNECGATGGAIARDNEPNNCPDFETPKQRASRKQGVASDN